VEGSGINSAGPEGVVPTHVHPYTVGQMMVHSGHELHSVASFKDLLVDDHRITLQGWGVWVPEVGWELFG
jgi:hypothetical protein